MNGLVKRKKKHLHFIIFLYEMIMNQTAANITAQTKPMNHLQTMTVHFSFFLTISKQSNGRNKSRFFPLFYLQYKRKEKERERRTRVRGRHVMNARPRLCLLAIGHRKTKEEMYGNNF